MLMLKMPGVDIERELTLGEVIMGLYLSRNIACICDIVGFNDEFSARINMDYTSDPEIRGTIIVSPHNASDPSIYKKPHAFSFDPVANNASPQNILKFFSQDVGDAVIENIKHGIIADHVVSVDKLSQLIWNLILYANHVLSNKVRIDITDRMFYEISIDGQGFAVNEAGVLACDIIVDSCVDRGRTVRVYKETIVMPRPDYRYNPEGVDENIATVTKLATDINLSMINDYCALKSIGTETGK